MSEELTEEERRGLKEIFKDPVRSAELSDRAIDVWIQQETGKRPKKFSSSSKRGSSNISRKSTG